MASSSVISNIEIRLVGTGKEGVAMGTEFFIAAGVFPIELLLWQYDKQAPVASTY